MELKRVVSQNIRHYRKMAGLTQEALGWETKLHPTYLGRVERAVDTISISNLEKIAKALKIEPYLLLIPESYKQKKL